MKPMKIVALLPFRNEEKTMRTCALSLCGVVDEIVAVDDASDDASRQILIDTCAEQNTPLKLHDSGVTDDDKVFPVERIRALLLEKGREAGGTHFVNLDADEAFTRNFARRARKVISKLQPGQKLTMQWLAMWKSLDHYKDDHSVWSNNYKDFIVCDNGDEVEYNQSMMHGGRTHGPNNEENLLRLNPKYGAVFHYQFSNWNSFQVKQCWYRIRDKMFLNKSAAGVNETYRITLDDRNSVVSAAPEEWMWPAKDLPVLEALDARDTSGRMDLIRDALDKHGTEPFKDLDIWHVNEIRALRDGGVVLPEPTEELEHHYHKTLPLFVSIPRAGCNWVQAVMELTFNRHRGLKNKNTPTWLDIPFKDPLWVNTHDNFNHYDLESDFPSVFLYRDPVDVIYSLLKLHKIPATDATVGGYCKRWKRCYQKWTTRDNVYSFSYETFMKDPIPVLHDLADWYGVPWNKNRAEEALKIAGDKKKTNDKNGFMAAFKNLDCGTEPYESERDTFRKQWKEFIEANAL